VDIAPPDIAVLTKVALAHAAYFPGGLPEIARGKAEVFSHPRTRLAIVDRGFLEYGVNIHCEKLLFSSDDAAAFGSIPFKESHILHNLGAAIAVARSMQMADFEIQKQIPYLQLPKMRFEQFEKHGIHFINDAYNANPESVHFALHELGKMKTEGKRIAVLGTMKELGSFSISQHHEMGLYAQRSVDHLLVLGEEAKPLFDAYSQTKKSGEFFLDQKMVAVRLKEIMKKGDVVLIKGSRSMNMDTILDYL
jgi:UDP-N-acetylmuramoyl-tripeptide--D-alanyl-D-alanine ligase